MPLSPQDMQQLAALVKAACGIVVPQDRATAIESRLGPVARRDNYPSVSALIERIIAQPDQAMVRAVVDALRISETQFFRDKTPFEQFRLEVLPAFLQTRPDGRVRVWSAGCSTGQEPYSLAITGEEVRAFLPALQLEIIATDVSDRCLEKAKSGLYTQFEVQRGLPVRMLIKHFEKIDDFWRASAQLRAAVRWGRFNLMHEPTKLGQFDIIFCRNVLTQFDEPTRAATLERLNTALAPDGLLYLGGDEAIHDLTGAFKPVPGRKGLYSRTPGHIRAVA
ncbi:MAG TPA: protein-glutamate O-methyltransferase CheR [Caulobacteraceae bacterium]|jgi:chemotaxis protein methyltransferase CheR|nr:protein-glutamate O-methyltransferase CheR [Caulobacteraceae bacterium]